MIPLAIERQIFALLHTAQTAYLQGPDSSWESTHTQLRDGLLDLWDDLDGNLNGAGLPIKSPEHAEADRADWHAYTADAATHLQKDAS